MIPFEQAFKPPFLKELWAVIINNVIDVAFLIDIIVTFFTSTINRNGVETFDSGEIAAAYIVTSRFKVDVIAMLGAE